MIKPPPLLVTTLLGEARKNAGACGVIIWGDGGCGEDGDDGGLSAWILSHLSPRALAKWSSTEVGIRSSSSGANSLM